MHKHVFLSLLLTGAALGCALPATAQKLTVQSQGQAEVEAKAQALTAKAVAQAVGEAPADKGQVVFFRSATSPGPAIMVEEGDAGLIQLEPGMYFVARVLPGMHGFDTGGSASLGVDTGAGQTHYVQVIRNRAGQPQLRRSSAAAFQRAAR